MPLYRNKREQPLIDITQTVIRSMRHLDKEMGEIGIEIEVEGKNLPRNFPEYWRVTRDGSLRGQEAYEYVIKKPLTRKQLPDALKIMTATLKHKGAQVIDSGRCGVHVHLNFQTVALRNLTSMVCLYFIFEDALTQLCGEGRTGNLFCLGTRYAENTMDAFIHYILYGNIDALNDDDIRYASLNLKALVTYGSLEFRSMRGTVDPVVISDWVHILLKLKDASLKYDNPCKILEDFSMMGINRFTKHIFGEMSDKVIGYTDSVYMQEAVWRIQPICYVRGWDKNKRAKNHSKLVEEPDIAVPPGGGAKAVKPLGGWPLEQRDFVVELPAWAAEAPDVVEGNIKPAQMLGQVVQRAVDKEQARIMYERMIGQGNALERIIIDAEDDEDDEINF